MTDLLYGEVEEELRTGVREMLADRSPWTAVLGWVDGPQLQPYDPALWRTLAGMGAAGLAVPESLGGAGASWREVAVVAEELGRAVAPTPYLGSAVVATAALLACGPGTAAQDALRRLATGEATAALVVPFDRWPGAPLPPGPVVRGVADALTADLLLVPAGADLSIVDGAAVRRTPVVSLDPTRPLCDVEVGGAPAAAVVSGGAAVAVQAGLTAGAAIAAAEQLGVAGWCLDATVAHVCERYQFGRPVGSFQAVKHRLADLWVELTQARAASRHAAACLATGDPDLPVAAAVAKAHCSQTALRAAEECVQLHGGIGFTWEHPAHLYLKRARATVTAYGSPDRHRAALAGLVGLPPA
jgi:alkylation response protein AidB-like acyl-CoA dehydrogenase